MRHFQAPEQMCVAGRWGLQSGMARAPGVASGSRFVGKASLSCLAQGRGSGCRGRREDTTEVGGGRAVRCSSGAESPSKEGA